MILLYPLTILRTGDKIKLLAAVAVVADGTHTEVVTYTGDDNDVSISHAAYIMGRLIDALVNTYEIEVSDTEQQSAMRLAGQPERWVNT